MTFQSSEIGPKYDLGISTRDGSTLACLDQNGQSQQVSGIAYMASIDKQNKMAESTELQEKSQLVQFGSSNLIDREFDQWPQVTQGDWSGGIGQRVYGSNNDTTSYFDGEGLLWPLNDWVPQIALRGPIQGLPGATLTGPPSVADSATSVVTPGGSAAATQGAGAVASLKATGAVSLVGSIGAFLQGSNTSVHPLFGQATTSGHALVGWVSGQRQTGGGGPGNLGETGSATYSYDFSEVNSDNVIGTSNTFTVPGGGIYINSISVYFGGYTAAVNARLVVWNAGTGSKIIDSAQFSAAKGLSLKTQNVTQTFVAAATTLRIGFWRQQNQNAMWGVASSGSFKYATNVANDNNQPTNNCASPYVCGHIQAYLSYTTTQTSDITCSDGTWSKLVQQNSPDGNQQFQLWAKPNCGAAETSPTWTAAVGATPMHAQVGEFQNIATSTPLESSGGIGVSSQAFLTAQNAATDTVAGDLVLFGARWSLNSAQTATFADSMNNGATVTHAGDSGASALVQQSTFDYGILPVGTALFSSWGPNTTIAGGFIDGLGMGYATCYLDNQGPPGHWHAVFFSGDLSYDVDIGANTGSQQGPLSMHIAGGYLWILFSSSPNTAALKVLMLGCAYGSNVFVQLRSDALPTVAGSSGFAGLIQASFVGGKLYVAVLQSDADSPPGSPSANRNLLFVLDYSAGTGSAPSGVGAAAFIFPFARGFHGVDLTWQGSELLCSVSDGFDAYIYQFSPPFSIISTQVVLSGVANALINSVGSTVMVIAWTPGQTGVNRLELYTLNGSTLTTIPFTPVVPFIDSVTSCTAFGPYGMFAIGYATPGGVAGQKTVTIYAYDVVRSRLFRGITFSDISWTGSDQFGHNIFGLFGTNVRTLQTNVTFQAQFGLAIFSGFLSSSLETAREFYWGIQPLTPTPAFTGLLQMGVDIISGLIDFTAATNKLFRAKVSDFINGLVIGQSSPYVQLNSWMDQDPNRLALAPDFTTTTGTPASLGNQLNLNLTENRVARKTVYEIISAGGGYDPNQAAWLNAPKLVDVIVQAATGWVWDLVLDLSPNVKSSTQNAQGYAYQAQSVPLGAQVDHVVAYNFLRQLWRIQGGRCTLSLPNGDQYSALIQAAKFESPKPFAASFRADQKTSVQWIATLKIREDI